MAQDFVAQNGDKFNDFILSASYTKDTRDTAIFPTDGNLNTMLGRACGPWQRPDLLPTDLQGAGLHPPDRAASPCRRVAMSVMAMGTGTWRRCPSSRTTLPAVQIPCAVGRPVAWGLRETGPNYAPVGGNLKLIGSVELFAPPPLDGDFAKTLRLGLFFDFGNVWETYDTPLVAPTGFSLSDLAVFHRLVRCLAVAGGGPVDQLGAIPLMPRTATRPRCSSSPSGRPSEAAGMLDLGSGVRYVA